LWAAYAVSSYGSGLGFGAFALIAIRVLHAGPAEVSALSAVGLAVGAVVAVPSGGWMEYRRKRPVMIAMDLARFAALMTIPVAYALGALSFWQLLAASTVVAAAKIAFNAASGAHVKSLVRPEDLIVANARFESTMWTSTVLGPPLGGAAVGIFGPVTTVIADAVSYVLSAFGIGMIGGGEARPPCPVGAAAARFRLGDLLDGWRYILVHRQLRLLFLNRLAFNGLVMATEPLLAVLMLATLKFAPWQYSLAFAAPCTGGLVGSRLSRRLVNRFGACVHGTWYRGSGAVHRGGVRADREHQCGQPGGHDLPATAAARGPGRAGPVGMVGEQQPRDRGPDRPVGRPGHGHRPPRRDRDRWRPVAGYSPTAARLARPPAGASSWITRYASRR
jgi:hypothetical protein